MPRLCPASQPPPQTVQAANAKHDYVEPEHDTIASEQEAATKFQGMAEQVHVVAPRSALGDSAIIAVCCSTRLNRPCPCES